MPISEQTVTGISAFEIIAFAVVSTILAQMWQRFFNNLLSETFGFSEKSWWTAFVLSVALTAITIYFIISFPVTLIGFL